MKVAILVLCTISAALASPYNSWRIVGGQDAEENQFPYQVSLRYYGSHSCGGSIIDETTVLCAAHCVDGRGPSAMSVRVGNNKLNGQTEEYDVSDLRAHEDYNPYEIYNDVSIIKLASPIKFHEAVQPVKLRETNIAAGSDVVLSGWGTTSYPGSVPNDLQWINLKTISVEQCQEAHTSTGLPVFESEVCTLTKKGEGACHGDSGGPLVDSNGEQIGIVSWGNPCAKGYPDVFTRVYSFLSWIEENRH